MNMFFNEEEIKKILSDEKVNNYNKDKLDIRTLDIFKYLLRKKFKKLEIKNMILEYPRLLTNSVENISSNYENLEKLFNKSTNKLIINNPRMLGRNKEYIENRIEYLTSIGFKEKDAKKMCVKFPNIMTIGEINIEISINNLNEIITDKKVLLELIKSNPNILSFSNKTINNKIEWFYKKGYNKEQTTKIITKATSLLTMEFEKENSDSNIEQKYKYLHEELKYTKTEIIDITTKFPEYYTLSLNTIKTRINSLIRLGFNIETTRYIFYNFPQIISFKIDTLNKKYNYYQKLNMLDIFIKNPKYLMQSLELTDARYKYLINKKLDVTNYSKLFLSDKKFKKTYGIDNKELIKIYKEKEGYYEQGTNKRNTFKSRTRIKEDK